MKKLTKGQMAALVAAVDLLLEAGPDVEHPPTLYAAKRKLEEGLALAGHPRYAYTPEGEEYEIVRARHTHRGSKSGKE